MPEQHSGKITATTTTGTSAEIELDIYRGPVYCRIEYDFEPEMEFDIHGGSDPRSHWRFAIPVDDVEAFAKYLETIAQHVRTLPRMGYTTSD